MHSAIDAYSRLAYSETLDDETTETALAFWARAREPPPVTRCTNLADQYT